MECSPSCPNNTAGLHSSEIEEGPYGNQNLRRREADLKEKASAEFRRFLVIFLYLWVVFGLLSLHKSIVMSQLHLDTEEHAFAIVNAFVFAKVLLVGEHFKLGTRFRSKPLIYPILYKSFVSSVVLIVFHIIESAALGLFHGHTIAESLPPFLGRGAPS